jgi:hypothetical protein
MDEATVIAEALELETDREQIRADVDRMLPGELVQCAEQLRSEISARWPQLEPLLVQVDAGERIRGSDWQETQLGREAFLELLRYESVLQHTADRDSTSVTE